MADEKIESPGLEPHVPKAEEVKPQTPDPEQTAALIAELEKAGVTNAKQLEGKFQAATERGHLANILGEVKRENDELKQMVRQLAEGQKKAARSYDGDETQPGAIDIKELIASTVDGVFTKREQKALEQQQRAYAAWQAIQQDEDYNLIANDWEAKLRDPNFAIKLQSGAIDPVQEYQRMLRNKYKKTVSQAAAVIKSLTTGAAPPQVHVEGSARVAADKTVNQNDKQTKINALKDKVNKGKNLSESEELEALMAVLKG